MKSSKKESSLIVLENNKTKHYNLVVPLSYHLGDLLLVRCSNCGMCCEETMMELSSEDIRRLEKKGYCLEEFSVTDDLGTRLRNVDSYCYFYSRTNKKCHIYENRPLGCYLYPVMYLENKSVTVDKLCPRGQTISAQELRTKGKILCKLLKTIDNEHAHH